MEQIHILCSLISRKGEIAGVLFNATRAYRFYCDPTFKTTFTVERDIIVENNVPYWHDPGVPSAAVSYNNNISNMRRRGWEPFNLEHRTVMFTKFKKLFFMAKLADDVHGPFPWIGL